MADFDVVFEHRDLNLVRVMRAALEAHGFSPRPDVNLTTSSFPGIAPRGGYAIVVPMDEAADARLLLDDLMGKGPKT